MPHSYMKAKRPYLLPSQKSLVIYPLVPTSNTISLAQAEDDDYADTGGDVKAEQSFSTNGGGQRNLWDEVW